MKVLIDCHSLGQKKTGIERYSANIINSLVEIFHKSAEDNELIAYLERYRYDSPRSFLVKKAYNPSLRNGLYRILFGIPLAIRKYRPDLLHVNFFSPLIKTIPTVITVHDICFDQYPAIYALSDRLIFRFFFRRSLYSSDAIICDSEVVKKNLINRYALYAKKIFTVHLGPDPVIGYISDKKKVINILRKKFSLSGEYFLVVGNVEPRKNPLETIEAFIHAERAQDIILVFAGHNKMNNQIKILYGSLLRSGKLRILNYLSEEDLNLIYNGALALVYNSICEGFGLPLVEAMSCRLPIICSDIPTFREISGKAGIYVKTRKDLTKAMDKIIIDEDYRKRFSRNSYIRSQDFSWEKAAEQTLQVYKHVLSQKRNNNNH